MILRSKAASLTLAAAVGIAAAAAFSAAFAVVAPDYRSPRVLVDGALSQGTSVVLTPEQERHIVSVLRIRTGGGLRLFNDASGEWAAELRLGGGRGGGRRGRSSGGAAGGGAHAVVMQQLRPPRVESGPRLLFAPPKSKALAYLAEKATELGAAELQPVRTSRSELGGNDDRAADVIRSRIQTAAREAAEQCERLTVPVVRPLANLDQLLDEWLDGSAEDAPSAPLLVALERSDERGVPATPLLRAARQLAGQRHSGSAPPSLLVGPEGGFTQEEADSLAAHPATTLVSLGPRILRVETAACAALAVLQSVTDDDLGS